MGCSRHLWMQLKSKFDKTTLSWQRFTIRMFIKEKTRTISRKLMRPIMFWKIQWSEKTMTNIWKSAEQIQKTRRVKNLRRAQNLNRSKSEQFEIISTQSLKLSSKTLISGKCFENSSWDQYEQHQKNSKKCFSLNTSKSYLSETLLDENSLCIIENNQWSTQS